jgi:hypothetical protein
MAAEKAGAQWLLVELDNCATDMEEAVRHSARFLVSKGLAAGACGCGCGYGIGSRLRLRRRNRAAAAATGCGDGVRLRLRLRLRRRVRSAGPRLDSWSGTWPPKPRSGPQA